MKATPPMDVLWFRLPRRSADPRDQITFYVGRGLFVFLLDRGDQWQVGYGLLKGHFAETKRAGIGRLRADLAQQVPWIGDRVQLLQDWKQIVVLSVESNRVPVWHQPGLLLIGDAAHVMSPVGGVGINYAIQDAIEAANLLHTGLKNGSVPDSELAEVQRRREPAVRLIQRFQGLVQDRVVKTALDNERAFRLPLMARILLRLPVVRDIPARLVAFGIRRARIDDALLEEATDAQPS